MGLRGQTRPESVVATDYVCPMDPDVHSTTPGKCPRCGMQLRAVILEPRMYELNLTANPDTIPARDPVELAFAIRNPDSHAPVAHYEQVHERLFHFFAVSQDLEWFLHDHPILGADGIYRLPVQFPRPAMYQVFSDFYPTGGTPQWIPQFLFTEGASLESAPLGAVLRYKTPQRDAGVEVNLELDPDRPIAGSATTLMFDPNPGDGLELYLGTYAHALWVSHDLLDAEHTHPVFFGNLQFEVYFPRPGAYRFWIQFQRKGTLHTMRFDIPVFA